MATSTIDYRTPESVDRYITLSAIDTILANLIGEGGHSHFPELSDPLEILADGVDLRLNVGFSYKEAFEAIVPEENEGTAARHVLSAREELRAAEILRRFTPEYVEREAARLEALAAEHLRQFAAAMIGEEA